MIGEVVVGRGRSAIVVGSGVVGPGDDEAGNSNEERKEPQNERGLRGLTELGFTADGRQKTKEERKVAQDKATQQFAAVVGIHGGCTVGQVVHRVAVHLHDTQVVEVSEVHKVAQDGNEDKNTDVGKAQDGGVGATVGGHEDKHVNEPEKEEGG